MQREYVNTESKSYQNSKVRKRKKSFFAVIPK